MAIGGHDFEPKNDILSFGTLETNLAVQHPSWTPAERHQEALAIFNTRMFPKQVESYLAEKHGQTEINVNAEYEVIDGKLVNRDYSFQNMIDQAATPEEKASLRLYQEVMVKALPGTYVVMPDLHSGRPEGHRVRYADISYKDRDGKVHLTKRVDLVQSQATLTLGESWQSFQELARTVKGRQLIVDGVPQVGIVVIPPSEDISVDKLTYQLKARSEPVFFRQRLNTTGPKEEIYLPPKVEGNFWDVAVVDFAKIGERVSTETRITILSVESFLKRKIKSSTKEKTVAHFSSSKVKLRKAESLRAPTFAAEKQRRPLPAFEPEKKDELMSIPIVDQSVKPESRLNKLTLAAGIKEPGTTLAARPRKKMSENFLPLKIDLREFGKSEKVKKPVSERRAWRIQRVIEQRVIKLRRTSREKPGIKQPEAPLKRREKRLLRQLRRWLGVLEKPQKAERRRRSEVKRPKTVTKEEKRAREKKILAKTAIAWIIWLSLAPEKSRVQVETRLGKDKAKPKALIEKEPRQWLLLAIVWYLSQLREQGRSVKFQVKRTKARPRKFTFPPKGIIFSSYS